MKADIIFLGLQLGLLFGLNSCSLDYDPVDTYSDVTEGVSEQGDDVVFKDKAAVESHLQTLYDQMRDRQEHWYVDLLLIAESHSDNAYAGTTGAETVPFENNSIDGSNSVLERDWNRYMEDIARANKLICNIDYVDDGSLTSDDRASYKAQAEIFRAMVMFDMVRIWGDIPVITTVADEITSENIDEVYSQYFPSQNTELEVYRQIEKDLLEGIPLIDDSKYAVPKYRFTKNAAYAFAARFYLNYVQADLSNYDKVIEYATMALGTNPSSNLRDWEYLGTLSMNGEVQPNEYVNADNTANLLLISAKSYWGYTVSPYSTGERYSHGPVVSYETNRSTGPWGSYSANDDDNI